MHSQLTQEQRCQTEALGSIGEKQKTIAAVVGVHPSTISREMYPEPPVRAARLLVVLRTGRATPSGCTTAPAGATHFTSAAHGSRAAHAQAGLDAEGTIKFVTVRVAGGASEAECLQVAHALAESPLVKTAVFAGDPSWGRFCMAIGRAGIDDLNPAGVSVKLDEVQVAQTGLLAPSYDEAAAAAVMAQPEFAIQVDLGRGPCQETVWTSDLPHEYIRINAEYRT